MACRLGTVLAAALVACWAIPSPARAGDDASRARLTAQAERFEQRVAERGLAYDDPELTQYLGGLAEALAGPGQLRIIVLRRGDETEFVLQNRVLYVDAGLLAKLDDESQLALLVASELAHLELDHLAKAATAERSAYVALHAGSAADPGFFPVAELALRMMLGSFSRDMDRAADRAALQRLDRVGFATGTAPRAFSLRTPSDPERESACRAWVTAKNGRNDVETLRRVTEKVAFESIRLNVQAERYHTALDEIQRATSRYGESASLRTYEGQSQLGLAILPKHVPREQLPRSMERRDREREEAKLLARLRVHEPEQLAAAGAAFRRALELEPGLGPAQRGLGEVLLHQKDLNGARAEFDRYLAANPAAPDRKLVAKLRAATVTPEKVGATP